ncbi:MAG TPA: DoxX family protein [Candidatus Paceibacterota bacterium]
MLNPFPDLLAFGLVAPLLLRVAVGLMFVNAGIKKLCRKSWVISLFERLNLKPASSYAVAFGVVEVVSGFLLVVGLFTQIASLATLVVSVFMLYEKNKRPAEMPGSRGVFLLLCIISLSLLFSGAGFLAFDVPL